MTNTYNTKASRLPAFCESQNCARACVNCEMTILYQETDEHTGQLTYIDAIGCKIDNEERQRYAQSVQFDCPRFSCRYYNGIVDNSPDQKIFDRCRKNIELSK